VIDETKAEFYLGGGRGPGEVSNLSVKCVLPGAGMLGRDKKVSQATEAVVSYTMDGKGVSDQRVDVRDARRLLEQAEASSIKEAERVQKAADARSARQAEIRERIKNLTCPICEGKSFSQQSSREDSQLGLTTLRMQLLVCDECSYVLHFSRGQSLYVPG
jgi:hypothetical protein